MLTTTALSVLAWMSLSLSMTTRLKTSYAAGLMFTACMIILGLFLGMIFGILSLTYYAIIIGALIQAILRGWTFPALISSISTKNNKFEAIKNSYFLLYVAAIIAIALFFAKVYPDFTFFGWDEFSHWARYTKILVNTSAAPIDNPAVLFPAYPPGINLWHYFICGPEGYAEWKVVFAQMLLVTSVIAFVSTGFDKLKGVGTIVIFTFGLMLYHAFGTSLYEIYTDCILGLLFGASLLVARRLAIEGSRQHNLMAFALLLATISLIKPIAVLFSLTACGMFLTLRVLLNLSQKFKKTPNTATPNIKSMTLGLSTLQTVQCLMATFSTVLVWKIYTSMHSVKDQLADSETASLNKVVEFLFTRETAETQIAWKELGDRIGFERISTYGAKQFRLDRGFLESDLPIYHGAIALLIATLGFMILRIIFNHRKGLLTLVEGFYLAITSILYLLVIVFITRYYFQLYDIERLASLERYLSSFLLGIMIYALTTLIIDISNLKKRPKFQVVGIAYPMLWTALSVYILSLAPIAFDNVFSRPIEERPVPGVHPWADEYSEMLELKQHIRTLSNIVKNTAEPEDKVYVVAQNETGFTFYMAGHELSPLETNPNCFSVGPKYSDADNWTCDWINFPVVLKEYDYLVLRRADDAFWTNFGEYFEPAARGYKSGVFTIDKNGETAKFKSIYLSDEARGEGSPT